MEVDPLKTMYVKRGLAFLLTVLLCLSLAACRESPTLQEIVYTYSAPEIDEEQDMLDPEDEGDEDEQFSNEEKDDVDTARDSEIDQGLEDDTGDADHSMETEYNPNAGNDWETSHAPSDGGQSESDDPPESAGESGEGGDVTVDPENTAGNVNTGKQVVDAAGRTVTLPENVDTVTAVRWAAQMVEMLGGAGRLAAADRNFLSSPLAAAAFSDLGAVSCLWEEDGAGGISSANFQKLLNLKPDVCFEISGENTFSNAQITQLQDAGIAYVVLPALSSHDNLKLAVNLLASILGTNPDTGKSAGDIAADYIAWADGIVQAVGSKTSDTGMTSLYISDWDENAAYQLNHTKGVLDSSGSGLAVAYSPLKSQMVSTYMNTANVVNEATRIRSTHRQTEGVYVAPMFHQFDPVVSGSLATFYSGAGEYGSAYDLFVARMVTDSLYYQLGGSLFPAVIVASEEIRDQIENNWYWQYHAVDQEGYVNVSGQTFYCGVIGEYDIYVNPQGMCDWAAGSVESPLEACWVAYQFFGAYTLDEVKAKTQSFYQQFFGLTLSDEQLTGIFGE